MAEGHFNTRTAFKLEREDRVKELRPDELLGNYAGLHNGMSCIDLGCGTGTFSFAMAKIIGDNGLICAIDDSEKMLGFLQKRNPPDNIVVIKGDVLHAPIKSGIADFCLLALILHELKDHKALIAEVNRLLKPEGKIMVLEWKANLRSPGPPKKRRIAVNYLNELLSQSNFTEILYKEWSFHHYMVMAVKSSIS